MKMDNSTMAPLVIDGMFKEADMYHAERRKAMNDAGWLAETLYKMLSKNIEQIRQICIELYPQEPFLYRMINETYRDENRDRFQTLWPFCYLLYTYTGGSSKSSLSSQSTRYRGEDVSSEVIATYTKEVETIRLNLEEHMCGRKI
jgi:hypothetical protein